MKSVGPSIRRQCAGSLSMELVVAIGVLSVAVIPFGYSFVQDIQSFGIARHHIARIARKKQRFFLSIQY